MKPVMSLKGCQALLKLVTDADTARRLLHRFALARLLAFLCDFLRASVRTEDPTWRDAQRVLSARYRQQITVAR